MALNFSTIFKRLRNRIRLEKTTVDIANHYRHFTSQNRQAETEDISDSPADPSKLKLVAYYLTQYHPIPENDLHWGKGFTEWTNTSKAFPLYEGHYQPRLPADLGHYDLRTPGLMQEQVKMAKKYGIYGFCFYYYWFDGKRLLETPLDHFLSNPSLDIKFCFCWANGNWTRKWDGSERDVIALQRYGSESYKKIILDIIPALKDPRYIRVDGKPVLIVYQVKEIPAPREMCTIWREQCKLAGIPELLILASNAFDYNTPLEDGLDGIAEFAPHGLSCKTITTSKKFFTNDFSGRVFDYGDAVRMAAEKPFPDYFYAKGLMVSWDNTARVSGSARIFDGSTPAKFQSWLQTCAEQTMRNADASQHGLVFVNAWNEWAEGTYLEPDRHYGYAYLRACRDIVNQYATEKAAQ